MAVKTAAIHIRIDPFLRDEAIALARADGRPLAQWVERLILLAVQASKDTTTT